MAETQGLSGPSGKLVVRNVGLMLSGALERPILDAAGFEVLLNEGPDAARAVAKES